MEEKDESETIVFHMNCIWSHAARSQQDIDGDGMTDFIELSDHGVASSPGIKVARVEIHRVDEIFYVGLLILCV